MSRQGAARTSEICRKALDRVQASKGKLAKTLTEGNPFDVSVARNSIYECLQAFYKKLEGIKPCRCAMEKLLR